MDEIEVRVFHPDVEVTIDKPLETIDAVRGIDHKAQDHLHEVELTVTAVWEEVRLKVEAVWDDLVAAMDHLERSVIDDAKNDH